MIKNNILMISYFFSNKGCCPAEWADDKAHALAELDYRVILLTSILSNKSEDKNIVHYRAPSLSINDLKHEITELKNNKSKIPYIKLIILSPLILLIGLPLDILQKYVTSGNGGGKWSWAIPAAICSLFLTVRHRCRFIFTTGGPASAHLSGVFAKWLTKKKLVCELQDPLTGKDIGRTSRSAYFLAKIEKFILNNADKVVYVTKQAANSAKTKYRSAKAKIVSIYPGSKKLIKSLNKDFSQTSKLTLIHLGTLYSTRNFYTLIEAIDSLIAESAITKDQIEILNLGEMYGDLKEHHLSKLYIKYESIKPRAKALEIASKYKVLLLMQHSDSRGESTIPYKTYDYINLSNPILSLSSSEELNQLLNVGQHISVNVNDVPAIKKAILNLVKNYPSNVFNHELLSIDIIQQTRQLVGEI